MKRRILKRSLCFALSLALLFTMSAPVFAAGESGSVNKTPVILVPGFSSAQLIKDKGTDKATKVWTPDLSDVSTYILDNASDFTDAVVNVKKDELIKFTDGLIDRYGEPISNNADGTSKYNVSLEADMSKISSLADLKSPSDNGYEQRLGVELSKKIGAGNVFVFLYDWRMSSIDSAAQLRKFVEGVKTKTGSSKVSLFGLSMGGEVLSVYLNYYSQYGDLDRVIMNVPGCCGTSLAAGMIRGDADFTVNTVLPLMQLYFNFGSFDLAGYLNGVPAESMNTMKNEGVKRIAPLIRNFPGVWDLVPLSDYKVLRNQFLDPTKNAAIIKDEDMIHFDVMANMSKVLEKAESYGTQVSIMSNYNSKMFNDSSRDGDIIIDTEYTSGSYCTAYGSKLPADYVQKNTACKNPEKYFISPERTVDASCGYLPEHTWYFSGQYHGCYLFDDHAFNLIMKLLTTNDIKDIYSDPEYPQFSLDQSAPNNIHAEFNNSHDSFLTVKGSKYSDTGIRLKNLNKSQKITVSSISINGVKLKFKSDSPVVLGVGETKVVPFTGKVPYKIPYAATMKISYSLASDPSKTLTRNIDITVTDGSSQGRTIGVPDIPDTGFSEAALLLFIPFVGALSYTAYTAKRKKSKN